jgi:hypothetical protein
MVREIVCYRSTRLSMSDYFLGIHLGMDTSETLQTGSLNNFDCPSLALPSIVQRVHRVCDGNGDRSVRSVNDIRDRHPRSLPIREYTGEVEEEKACV